ncbi:MAG: hypothetical protein J6Y69_10145 [Treponema sp.]|nr:hypothetical protein [Treponema sp.]
MFEKDAEIYALSNFGFRGKNSQRVLTAKIDYQAGAEHGYNKCKDELEQIRNERNLFQERCEDIEFNYYHDKVDCQFLSRNKWHYVKDGDLPKDNIKLAIIEIDDCGYLLCNYRNGFWCDANSGATCAEWITNNIIAWKEIVLPGLEENKE